MKLKLNILPYGQKQLWQELSDTPKNFVLYGGTALALRLGHRQSVDFDFFSSDSFNPGDLYKSIPYLQGAEKSQVSKNTLTCLLKRQNDTAKVSFFGGLSFARLSPPDVLSDPNIAIASLADLSATKIQVIQDRAEVKDYIDIAELLKQLSLEQMLANAMAVFGKEFNPLLSLKALVYYQDGNLPQLDEKIKQILLKSANQVNLSNLPTINREANRLI
jgi:predicted nucleotidyltransferase component of viral defense system